jgi:hypothetical protein
MSRVNVIKMRSVVLLWMMLLRVWLVPWIGSDLLWIVPIGLEFLVRKNVMLSERGCWSWSFHLDLDGRCWDDVGWFGVDHAFGFGLRGGIVPGIVLGVVGEGGARTGERSFGHVGPFIGNSSGAGRRWGSGEARWRGEVGAVDNSLFELSDGDPLFWIPLKDPT